MDCCPCRLCLLNTSANVYCQYCPRRQGLQHGAVLRSRCQASWKSATTTLDSKRTTEGRRHVWSVEGFALSLFEECAWVDGNECVSELLFLRCHSCGQTLDRGERCLGPDLQCPRYWHHHAPRVRVTRSQPGELLKPGRKRLLWRLLERVLLSENVGVCVEHIYKCFLSVLS